MRVGEGWVLLGGCGAVGRRVSHTACSWRFIPWVQVGLKWCPSAEGVRMAVLGGSTEGQGSSAARHALFQWGIWVMLPTLSVHLFILYLHSCKPSLQIPGSALRLTGVLWTPAAIQCSGDETPSQQGSHHWQ